MSFVHLHTHSHYSLLDGLPKTDELVRVAKKMGMTALALTDHGNMYGAIEFYEQATAAGIKPIIGMEAYLAINKHTDKRPKLDDAQFHLTLLARNLEGYRNLMKLATSASLDGFYYKPRLDKDLLRQYGAGLIALSGCLKGDIPRALSGGDFKRAEALIGEYQEIFGKKHFFLEIQHHPEISEQASINRGLIELSQKTDAPLVATADLHYLETADAEAQDVSVCIGTGRVITETNRFSMRTYNLAMTSPEEMAAAFADLPEAIANTERIAAMVDLKLKLGKWHFAEIELPPDKTAAEHLQDLVIAALRTRLPADTVAEKRTTYELDIINKKGYAPYFLIVSDFVRWARSQGIVVTTRGSAAGSIVSYLLDITTVNPLDYNLPFERFLNPFRPSPPDIDTDFADNRRDEVIAYVTQKYGQDKVAQICTFGTMAARAALRDVGRALGLPYSFCDELAKMIPMGSQGFPMTLTRAKKLNPDLKRRYDNEETVRRTINLAEKIEGCARHASVHAAGVVISPTPLTDFTPLQREAGGDKIITQYDMHSVEQAGLLKMDFLGIRNLSILGQAVKIVEHTKNIKVVIDKIPFNDQKTFELLARGETVGLFQLNGTGMTKYLMDLRPSKITDIMAMVALFRPGPMNSIPDFIRRKHNSDLIEYLDPRLKEILNTSYGIITYQDDVLLIAIHLAGYSWEEADKLRRAMGKKIPAEMAAQKSKFLAGCAKNNVSLDKAAELWTLIEPFAAYGFNKAHAASYGIVAYQTAYMKANFPGEYMTAVLTAEAGNNDTVAEAIAECRRMGIEVLPPDINESLENFGYLNDKEIRFGLMAIKNLGEDIAHTIIEERKQNAAFTSLANFLSRIKSRNLNKKSLEALIMSGALDRFGERGQMLENIESICGFAHEATRAAAAGQSSLFGGSAAIHELYLRPAPEATKRQRLQWEKELLGIYVSAHPLQEYRELLQTSTPLSQLPVLLSSHKNSSLLVAGLITAPKQITTKKNELMAFATLADESGSVELVCFPSVYQKSGPLLADGKLILVKGKLSEKEDSPKILVDALKEITEQTTLADVQEFTGKQKSAIIERSASSAIGLKLPPDLSPEQMRGMKQFLSEQRGPLKVYLLYQNGSLKKIATPYTLSWDQQARSTLEQFLGPANILWPQNL